MGIIENLLAAIEKNTAALEALAKAGGATTAAAPAAPAAAKPAPAKPAAAAAKPTAAKPKHTEDEVVAAITKVKEDFGKDAAVEVIKGLGFAKMADITADKYDAAVKAAEAKHIELSAEAGGDGEEDDGL